jgi:hypothetical protein
MLGLSSCISVSVSLTSSWLGEPGRSSDFLLAPAAFLASSSSFAIWISRANQLMPYQRPAQRPERTTKWMLEVAMRRIRRRSWRAPKEALVAMRRVGVGPGVKMDSQRSTRKLAMVEGLAGVSLRNTRPGMSSLDRCLSLLDYCEPRQVDVRMVDRPVVRGVALILLFYYKMFKIRLTCFVTK